MELLNATKLQTGYTMAVQPDGRERLVVVAKGTFLIPKNPEQEPVLSEEQAPLVHTDVFSGEPGFSAPLYEIDYAPHKPRCDVLLNGSAYAPGGKPIDRVKVTLRVANLSKSFDVVGDRVWTRSLLSAKPSTPKPFSVLPISYGNAFGGVDRSQKDEAKHRWYEMNHVGVGFHAYLDPESIDGKPLPNTEESGRPVTDPQVKYRPMAFGPVGRAWRPRFEFAGTYDQKWRDQQFPFLPSDFDDRYFQSAPSDQWIDYPTGGERVELLNLSPNGKLEFSLPRLSEPFDFYYKGGEFTRIKGVIDTLILEPDLGRFSLVLRASCAIRRNLHEIETIAVGHALPQRVDAVREDEGRVAAKTRYGSLAEMITAQRAKGPSR